MTKKKNSQNQRNVGIVADGRLAMPRSLPVNNSLWSGVERYTTARNEAEHKSVDCGNSPRASDNACEATVAVGQWRERHASLVF